MYNGSFYNPYMFSSYQTASNIGRSGLGLRGLFKGFNFNNFLTSTGKTLNVINQAIPIFYQIKPIFNNAKTMLRVAGAIRDGNSKSTNSNIHVETSNKNTLHNNISNNNQTFDTTNPTSNNPTFFL